MKHTITFLAALALVVMSCDNKAKQAEAAEKARQDSIKAQQDSIKAQLAYEDSIAIFAWGDAKFGTTMEEVLQTKSFSGGSRHDRTYDYWNHSDPPVIYMESLKEKAIADAIGLRISNTFSVSAYFGGKNDKELIRIKISAFCKWQYFDNLVFDIDKLVKEFTKKYGTPDFIQDKYIEMSLHDLYEIKEIPIAEWDVGSGYGPNGIKYISLVAKKHSDDLYGYEVSIINSDFPKEEIEKSAEEIKEEEEINQKEKDAVEYSF